VRRFLSNYFDLLLFVVAAVSANKDALRFHLVLVEVGKVVDDDGYRQRNDEYAADAARGADQLAPDGRRSHIAVADRRHGDCRPPERFRDADELGVVDVVLGEVGETREDEHADRDKHHQQAEFLAHINSDSRTRSSAVAERPRDASCR